MILDPSKMAEFTEGLLNGNTYHQGLRPDHLVLPLAGYSQFLKAPGYATEDAPPTSLRSDATDHLTIDDFLGRYDPTIQRITLFRPNIETAATILGCNAWDLTYVIRYHEYAHAALHLGVTAEEHLKAIQDKRFTKSRLQALTRTYMNIDSNLHEHLAQLVTYHVLKRLSQSPEHDIVVNAAHRMLVIFSQLMQRQPSQYRVERYLETPVKRLNLTVRLIKEELLVGEFFAWREIMELV